MDRSANRTLAVIVHADIVGSTRLVQLDESVAHNRITQTFKRFKDVIRQYNGNVHEIRGDALVAEFSLASDALCASLEFQFRQKKYLEELNDEILPIARIGITLGEVVIADGTVTGSGVVLAQRIEQLARPGSVAIQGTIHDTVPRNLPFEYEDLGQNKLKGFDETIQVYQVSISSGQTIPKSNPPRYLKKSITFLVLVSIFFGISSIVYFHLLKPEVSSVKQDYQLNLPDKPSIAVLPFVNLSRDANQDYFSDGLSEDLITDLSKLSSIKVISRTSSFAFKGENTDVRDIGKALGVTHIIEGSVRKDGKLVRISTQLVDTETGQHLWAERFDRKQDDIFLVIDEVIQQIVKALSIRLSDTELIDLEKHVTSNFEAYDLFLKGQRVSVQFSKPAINEAVTLYRQAIQLDPDYAHAYGALAVARIRQFFLGHAENPVRMKDRALELALKAATMDPSSHQIQWSLGYIHMYRKEFQQAAEAAKRAINLSPNYADGYALLALIKNNEGQADEALSLIEKAKSLNPYYTWDYIYQIGRAHYAKGEYEKAASYLNQAIERNEDVGYPRLFLAASYVHLDRLDDAEWEIEQLKMLRPHFSYSFVKNGVPIENQQLLDRFLADVKTAGLTE